MSVPQEDSKNNLLRGKAWNIADCDAFAGLRKPTAFMQKLLESGGMASLATTAEVVAADLAGVKKVSLTDPEFGDDLMAHHVASVADMGHVIVATPRLVSVQERLLRSAAVSEMLVRCPNWRTRALLAAAAIEYRLPILGASRFYRVLDEERRLPAGVRDPRTGVWLVPPTL